MMKNTTNRSNESFSGGLHQTGALRLLPLFVLLLASACSFSLAEDITPPPGYQAPVVPTQAPAAVAAPVTALDPAAGAPLYAEKCAPCHGESGMGDGSQAAQLPNPATRLGDRTVAVESAPADWYGVITNGRMDRFMPPFTSLSDQERWDVLAYVYTLSVPQDALADGEALYLENCAECHGASGDSAAGGVNFSDPAALVSRSTADLFQSITAGVSPSMPAFGDQLDEDSRWSLAFYLRTLAYRSSSEAVAEVPAATASGTPEAAGTPEAGAQEPAPDTVSEGPALLTGSVTGKVENGSGGGIPDGLAITLHGFDHIEEVYTSTTTISADGSFLFENVDMLPSRVYMVTVDYNQATYSSDLGIVETDTQVIDLPITVFDTTTDTSLLVVDRLHMFVESVTPGQLEVTELYLISNPSDRVVVAPEAGEPVIMYSVPPEAINLRFQDGSPTGRYIPTADGFGDTAGILPGTSQHQVMFAYDLPYDSEIDLSKPHSLPVNAVIVLMPEMGVQIKSDQLQDTGPRDIQGQIFEVYTGDRIEADQPLVFSLTGRVAANAAVPVTQGSPSSLIIGLVAFGVALVVAGVWLFRRNQGAWVPASEPEPESAGNGSVDRVVDAIIALDDLHLAGELPEDAYRKRRAELKAQLKEMVADRES